MRSIAGLYSLSYRTAKLYITTLYTRIFTWIVYDNFWALFAPIYIFFFIMLDVRWPPRRKVHFFVHGLRGSRCDVKHIHNTYMIFFLRANKMWKNIFPSAAAKKNSISISDNARIDNIIFKLKYYFFLGRILLNSAFGAGMLLTQGSICYEYNEFCYKVSLLRS